MTDERAEPPAGGKDEPGRALPPDRPGTGGGGAGPGDPDATRPLPPDGSGAADVARAMPPGPDRSPGAGGADATRPLPPGLGGGTSAPEPVGGAAPVPPAWSGRAGVPPPRPAGYPEAGAEWYAEEQAGRRWWMPILLGILALVLIALIGLGGWLALRAAERNPGPPSASSGAPSTLPATSAAPTTTAPSSSPPTASPTSAAPARVPVPPLVGLPEATARAVLDQLGIEYRVVRRTSDQPAGTVIGTDPAAGELISEGDQLTVMVARAAPSTSATATPEPGPTATATP